MDREKTLRLSDMLGMALAAFVSMELIASQAALGPSVVLAFLIIGGTYVFSHSVICAELGSTYPDQGGIYAWVKRGLGDKWAARTGWWYWLNVVGFVPSIMIPMVSIFKQLFWPDMPLSAMIIISIVCTWGVMLFNFLPLKDSKQLSNVGTIAKVLFCLILIGGGIYFACKGFSQVQFTSENIVPSFDLSLITLIPVFVYGLTGMDVIGCAAEEMHNPKRDMPKAMIISTIVAMVLYLLCTIAVEIILPVDSIDTTTGLIDAITVVFGASRFVIIAIGVVLALVFLSNAFSWTLGANKAAQEASTAGEFPAFYGLTNKHGSPIGGAILLGISSTALLILYGFIATSNESLFWTILAFTGIVFFLPYILMDIAFIKLRKDDPETERPFRVAGKRFPFVVGIFNLVLLVGSCIFFCLPTEGENPVLYVGMLVGTLVGTQIIGEVMIHRAMKNRSQKALIEDGKSED